MQTETGFKYGELIVIGTNGHPSPAVPQNLFELFRAEYPTALSPSRVVVQSRAERAQEDMANLNMMSPRNVESREARIHMEHQDKVITVTCTAVMDKDMFQMGRAQTEKVPVCIDMVPPPAPGATSTVSRYAARILVNRRPINRSSPDIDAHNPRIYAAAFDDKDEIFLGEHASTLDMGNEEYDGFTTNGVLLLRPPSDFKLATATVAEIAERWYPQWLEVSVGGRIFKTTNPRQPPKSSADRLEDTNHLADGSLIDLCGVMLLYRSYTSLSQPQHISQAWLRQALATTSPGSGRRPKRIISCVSFDAISSGLPSGRPFDPSKDTLTEEELDAHPFVYTGCGHVVTRRRIEDGTLLPNDKCPVKNCEKPGRLTQLQFSLEASFFLDPPPATHCFVPCGHAVPEKTALVWSRIKPPRVPCHAVCPFCAKPLDTERPYVKLELTYDEDEDNDDYDFAE